MIRSNTGWIRWGTDLFVPPVIVQGNNGWVYRPDEARTPEQIARGTNKAFPRSNGYSHAATWFENYLRDGIAARGWEVPTSIEKPEQNPRYATDSLSVAYKTQPWGWVSLMLHVGEQRNYSRYDSANDLIASYSMRFHDAVLWWEEQRLDGSRMTKFSHTTVLKSRKHAHQTVKAFMDDPWYEASKFLPLSEKLLEILKPPIEDLRNLPYPDDGDDEHDVKDIVSRSNGSMKFWKVGEIEKIMSKDVNWEALRDILGAFKHLGYQVSVQKSHQWNENQASINAVEVTIPKDPKDRRANREVDHKVKFTPAGISIECGFEKDEAKWLERETRKAREAMSLMAEELGVTEFTIEL
jgi:hypothetical protein